MTHWTDQDLIHWVYGLQTDEGHLQECPECAARAQEAASRRREAVRDPEIPWEFLAAQRRSIYRRLGQPIGNGVPLRSIISVAMLLIVIALGLSSLRNSQPNLPLSSPSDQKLFSDLNSIEQSNEPRAIEPLHHLFEE